MINFEEVVEQVKNDLELRKLVQASRSWGVSPRRLLGLWEPSFVTVYEYDQAGQVIRTVRRYETPEWDDLDRYFILALDLYEASLCDGCGHPLEETSKAENTEAYIARSPVRCHRCTAQIQAMEASERPQAEALRWPIEFDQARVLDLEKWAIGDVVDETRSTSDAMINNHEDHL